MLILTTGGVHSRSDDIAMMALSPLVMMLVAPMICIYNRSKN